MFKQIPSDRGGFLSAQISEDNLIISWPALKGPSTEPPWNDLYMEQYHKEFMEALRDFEVLRRIKPRLASGPAHD